ncbi:MAG: rhodanese-like domain-containing protein [Legionellales bacterium]
MPLKTINASTLKQWLDAEEALLIDVREPDEYQVARIPGALLKPLSTFSTIELPDAKDKKLVLHCKAGIRSHKAGELLLAKNPHLELFSLEGGIISWASQGNPIEN